MLFRKRIIIPVLLILAVPAVMIAWWLLSPLFMNERVDEEFPLAANAVIPAGVTMAEAEQRMIEAAADNTMYDEAVPKQMAMPDDSSRMDASVTAVKSGSFRDADSFHRGSGTATIYRAAAGETVLRLEDFSVTNGPDLHALLVPHPDPQSRGDVEGYLDLGQLKGNMGNQNYFLPAGEDGSDYGSVVIYCIPFRVIFSVATLN